jgi:hypothetical protein
MISKTCGGIGNVQFMLEFKVGEENVEGRDEV